MHSNSHPNGSYYSHTVRHVQIDGRWSIAHVHETCYETRTECYRVLDVPLTGERHLILRCERIAPDRAKGYGWARAIAAADEATTHDKHRNGHWGPVVVKGADHA